MADTLSLADTLREVYAILDAGAEKLISQNLHNTPSPSDPSKPATVSCRIGCAHCCYQLTTISTPEGIVLAENILAGPRAELHGILRALHETALADCAPRVNRRNRYDSAVPCALLDLKTNTCSTYADRPGCCRFHVVVTDPVQCSGDATGPTGALDLLDIEGALWEVTAGMSQDLGVEPYVQAPIAVMVLHVLPAMFPPGPDREYVERFSDGIPSPVQWIVEHAQDLFDEEQSGEVQDPRTTERLVQIGKRVFG